MINLKYNILFFPDKEKVKNPKTGISEYKPDGRLRMRIRWNKKTVNFNVGFRVKIEKQWDETSQRCKHRTSNLQKKSASQINSTIQLYEDAIEEVFKAFSLEDKDPSKEELKQAFNSITGKGNNTNIIKDRKKTFFDYFDLFIDDEGAKNEWTIATTKKLKTTKNHILEMPYEITFDFFDEKGLIKYIKHLRDVKNLRNSTIQKQLKFLKWFLRWASKNGYNNEKAFENFQPKLKTTEKKVIFLSWEELMQVYRHKFPKNKAHLERVRDVFCFQCFTSLRYSDVANLKRHNISEKYIEVVTVKTTDSLRIELNDYSSEILKKYEGEEFANNLALPVISNQKMNDYLKLVAEDCKINEPVNITYYKGNVRHDETYPKYALMGTHAGRRTFICNALMLGIPAQTVMKWTGHSDYKSMKPYIDIADKEKENAMKLFNKR